MRVAFIALVVVAALAVVQAAHADTVTPSDRVQDFVTVRSAPQGSASKVGPLDVGHEAALLSSVPGWRKVRLDDGTVGFVPKGWTTVITAADEAAATATTPPDAGMPAPTAAGGNFFAGMPKATRPAAEAPILDQREVVLVIDDGPVLVPASRPLGARHRLLDRLAPVLAAPRRPPALGRAGSS